MKAMPPCLIKCFWKRVNAVLKRDYANAHQWDRVAMGLCALYDIPEGRFYGIHLVTKQH